MIRRNPPKKLKSKKIPTPLQNLGGHLPYPPEDCEKKEMWTQCYGTIWIDLACCFSCPKQTRCKRRKEYLKDCKVQPKKSFE